MEPNIAKSNLPRRGLRVSPSKNQVNRGVGNFQHRLSRAYLTPSSSSQAKAIVESKISNYHVQFSRRVLQSQVKFFKFNRGVKLQDYHVQFSRRVLQSRIKFVKFNRGVKLQDYHVQLPRRVPPFNDWSRHVEDPASRPTRRRGPQRKTGPRRP